MDAFKTPKKLEKDLQRQVLNFLNKEYPHGYWRKLSDKTRSHLPDIIGICNGIPIAIELKRHSKKPREGQYAELDAFSKSGGLSNWFDDVEKAKEWIRSILK